MYVCMYVCMYECKNVYVCITFGLEGQSYEKKRVRMNMYVCMYACLFVCMYV